MSNELDLQYKTRMMDVYHDINDIIDRIGKLPVFPSLVWVYAWDVCVSTYEGFQDGSEGEYGITMDLEEVWALFWEQADQNGFTLEYGSDDLYEHIRDWMIDQSIVEEMQFDEDEDEVVEL